MISNFYHCEGSGVDPSARLPMTCVQVFWKSRLIISIGSANRSERSAKVERSDDANLCAVGAFCFNNALGDRVPPLRCVLVSLILSTGHREGNGRPYPGYRSRLKPPSSKTRLSSIIKHKASRAFFHYHVYHAPSHEVDHHDHNSVAGHFLPWGFIRIFS